MNAPAYPYTASTGSRVGAYLIDAVVATLAVLVGYAVVLIGFVNASEGLVLVGFVLTMVIGLGYPIAYIVVHGRSGTTPGKRVLGIRTVDVDTQQPIGVGRAFVRQLVLGILGPINLVQLFTIPSHPRRQGWHDSAARSVVVRAELLSRRAPTAPDAAPALAHGPRPAAPWPQPSVPNLASAPPAAPPQAVPGRPVTPPPAQVGPPPGIGASAFPAPVEQAGTVAPPPGGFTTPQNRPPAPPAPAPAPAPRAPAPWLLSTTAGERHVIGGSLLVGRDPDPGLVAGATTWVVDATELSVSKTHARFGVGADGAWVEDWHSTNGTVVRRAGSSTTLAPHTPTGLSAGDEVVLGDLTVVVGRGEA